MISELHNLANKVLGVERQPYFSYYRLVILNNNYTIRLFNNSGDEISPIKITVTNTYEYRLHTGEFTLVIQNENSKMIYQEKIIVTDNMLGTVRTINI